MKIFETRSNYTFLQQKTNQNKTCDLFIRAEKDTVDILVNFLSLWAEILSGFQQGFLVQILLLEDCLVRKIADYCGLMAVVVYIRKMLCAYSGTGVV
jgi:hypothetical protein